MKWYKCYNRYDELTILTALNQLNDAGIPPDRIRVCYSYDTRSVIYYYNDKDLNIF